jgi:membrane fusion protein (multidrug efflux system)
MTRRSVLVLLIGLILACGPREEKEARRGERVFEVRTVEARITELPINYTTSGYLEAVYRVEVRPEVSGRVVEVRAEEGDRVARGDVLFRIEEEVYRKAYEEVLWSLREAERDLENLKAVYERRRKLFEKDLISREEFEEVRTRWETLRARVERLRATLERRRIDLQKTVVRSPIEGVVVRRFVSPGDYVTPQTKAYELVKTNPLRFVFKVPQEVVTRLSRGKEVVIRVGGREVKGKVLYVSPTADEARMFTVKAEIGDPGGFLKPNMYGEVSFEVDRRRAVLVPEEAVRVSQRQSFLWVVRNSRATKVPVEVIAHREGGLSAVVGEVREGDRVVVEGLMFLYEGARVVER